MRNNILPTARCACFAIWLAALTACGGGDSPVISPTYTVGGTVTGLTGSGLVLESSGVDLPVSTSGAFTFAAPLVSGSTYSVSIKTQPSSPTQLCSIANDTGTIASGNVTTLLVTCGDEYTVGGTVSGLVGAGLVLQIYDSFDWNYIGSPLEITADGMFTLDSFYPAGTSTYDFVRLKQQPTSPTQYCQVNNATINIQTANITNVQVLCSEFSYVANAGDDTVSAYTVDAASGTLTAVAAPVATGSSPTAIVGTRNKKYVFVANAGSNDISAFAVNPSSGALTETSGSPVSVGTDPQALALAVGGNIPYLHFYPSFLYYLYVANAGSDTLSAFAVNMSTGALTPLSIATFATGQGPSSIAIDPSGAFIYVANHGGSNNISAFSIDGATGLLTEIAGSPFAAGGNPLSLAFGAAGKFLYAANSGPMGSSVSGFSVDPLSGALIALSGSPFPLAVSNGIATDGTGAYLYVTTGTTVAGYRIDATTGLLTSLTGFPVAAGANAYAVTLDPTNQFLYVANDGATNISGFRLDASTGGLTPIAGSPFAAGNSPDSLTAL